MKYDYEYEYEKNVKTKKGNTFHFKLKANRLSLGLLFVACAVLIMLDAVGISLGFLSGIPAWVMVLGALNLFWLLDVIIKLKISEIFLPLAFTFMLFEKYIARWAGLGTDNIINNWLLLLCALLLMAGVKLIKPKKCFKVPFIKSGNNRIGAKTSKSNHSHSMGASTVYVDCESEEDTVYVINELGYCEIYFSNVEKYTGEKTLAVTNKLGSMEIHVPSEWQIVCNIDNSLGSVEEPANKGSGDKTLYISGTNELGSMEIRRS